MASGSPNTNAATSPIGNLTLAMYEEHIVGSGIADWVANRRRYRTVTTADAELLERLGFTDEQRLHVPALLIPLYALPDSDCRWTSYDDWVPTNHELRPDCPRVPADGRVPKYDRPPGKGNVLDVNPFSASRATDASIPMLITEGVKKADAVLSARNTNGRGLLLPVALQGVSNWRTNGMAHGDWFRFKLKDRIVYVCFDSDVMAKREVHGALSRLVEFLRAQGAVVKIIYLPAGPDGAKVGIDDYLVNGNTIVDALNLAVEDLRPLDANTAILTMAELVALPTVPMLVEQLLPADGLTIVYGRPGTFKSFIALDWLACIAGGIPDWFGVAIHKHGPVLHIYSEGRAGLGQRVRAVSHVRHLATDAPLLALPSSVDIADPAAVEALVGQIQTATGHVAPACLVIDTLARNLVGDENQQVDVGRFIAGCDRLRTMFGCQVIVVHHHNAAGKVRGSTTLPGAADTMLELEREGDDLSTTLRVRKQKDGEQGTTMLIHLRKEADSLVVSGVDKLGDTAAAEPDPLTDGQQAVFSLLAQAPNGLKFGEWVMQAVEAYEVSKPTVGATRTKATKAKLIWLRPDHSWALTPQGVTYAAKHGWSAIV